MTFLAVFLALVLEQLRPLVAKPTLRLPALIGACATRWRTIGEPRMVWLAWFGVVLASVALVCVGSAAFAWVGPVGTVLFDAVVVYLLLGLRAGGVAFSDIHLALGTGDNERARELLRAWTGLDCARASSSEVARVAIEHSLVLAHRKGFGLVFWFVFLGPVGAVAYRVAGSLAHTQTAGAGAFRDFSQRAFALIDWLPVRLTGLFFSVIGNFEDAIYCWRSQSMLWPDKASGILIASGAGALGVRLGLPIHTSDGVVSRPEMGSGHKADTDHMQGAAELVWRVLLLWLLLIALFGLAGLVGR
nr:CobD/CbiB family protein [Zoogloeaceae bacterium]